MLHDNLLVPQEAIDAAIQRASELFIHGGYTEYERIEQALETAAPHIAAKALRDLAREVQDDTLYYETCELLNNRANDIEAGEK